MKGIRRGGREGVISETRKENPFLLQNETKQSETKQSLAVLQVQ